MIPAPIVESMLLVRGPLRRADPKHVVYEVFGGWETDTYPTTFPADTILVSSVIGLRQALTIGLRLVYLPADSTGIRTLSDEPFKLEAPTDIRIPNRSIVGPLLVLLPGPGTYRFELHYAKVTIGQATFIVVKKTQQQGQRARQAGEGRG